MNNNLSEVILNEFKAHPEKIYSHAEVHKAIEITSQRKWPYNSTMAQVNKFYHKGVLKKKGKGLYFYGEIKPRQERMSLSLPPEKTKYAIYTFEIVTKSSAERVNILKEEIKDLLEETEDIRIVPSIRKPADDEVLEIQVVRFKKKIKNIF